jgi:LmbE family N-acetylglucosaminyl deacetylase
MNYVTSKNMNNSTNPYTLLAVLAHPDDESFGMGGTLALYAQRGVAVHLVCATRGEAGTVDADFLEGYSSIADRREAELRCAAQNLGLAGVHFLDYRDSGMPGSPDNQHPQALVAAPLEQVADRVAYYIRLLKPQVVLTFDPIGGYKHPDHIAIHQATVLAFDRAGSPALQDDLPPYRAEKLYFHVIPRGVLRLAVKAMPLFGRDPRYFGRNKDINLAELAEEGSFPIHARINYHSVAKQKDAASLCHASQLGGAGLRRGPMRWAQFLFGQNDYFMRALPAVRNGKKENDLLAGLQLGDTARVVHPS